MSFVQPEFEREVVDRAGEALLGYDDALEYFPFEGADHIGVINNWRAAHLYPLNSFAMTLRNRTQHIDDSGLVAQRVKRLSSIEMKLARMPTLSLSEMQDIAGCRVIVNSVPEISALVELYKRRKSPHILDHEDDYIRHPKSDGYRGYHLIYRYSGRVHKEYEGLKVEIQLRTSLQHCWATAVETADTFFKEGLKQHRGSPEWRRFFALMGGAIALREGCRRVPQTPKDEKELADELRALSLALDVGTRLQAFGESLSVVESAKRSRVKYIVIVLDPKEKKSTLYGYRAHDLTDATERYAVLESHRSDGSDAVLVSVPDMANLRRAYPNYFLDTHAFLGLVKEFTS